jgi:hypothetical protein
MWHKSTYSNATSSCVEVAVQPTFVAVRDTEYRHGPVLTIDPADWRAFTTAVRHGEFDLT